MGDIKKALDIPKEVLSDNERQRRVYDSDGISPGLLGRQDSPKILEPVSTRGDDVAGTIRASIYKQGKRNLLENLEHGKGYEGIIEPHIVASRGRGDENMQQLEHRTDGVTNSLTTVQKDNYVCEPTGVLEQPVDRDYNLKGKKRETHFEQLEGGISYALRARNNGACVVIPEKTKQGYKLAHDGDGVYTNRPEQKRGCVQDGMIQTIKSSCDDIGVVVKSRIRKLTPLECWRLMGFDDEDFHAAQGAGISNSQLYKQAGNSIVVDVLEELFCMMFDEEGEFYV